MARAPKKFIEKAIKRPGALRAALRTPKGENIPATKLARAAKAPGRLGRQARFAKNVLAKVRPGARRASSPTCGPATSSPM